VLLVVVFFPNGLLEFGRLFHRRRTPAPAAQPSVVAPEGRLG
jgi:hypothetical protein